MTPKQVRAALRNVFSNAGFVLDGPVFARQSQELAHRVEILAVRRIAGYVEIHHHVSPSGDAQPIVSEELASHRHNSAYPKIWSAASVDGRLVVEQVSAIYQTFQTNHDLAHFLSDRFSYGEAPKAPNGSWPSSPNSLSAAETTQVLQRLAREFLRDGFSLVRGNPDFEIWSYDQAVEGYHHCLYFESNYSGTLADLVTFSLPSNIIEDGLQSDAARRMLMVAQKNVLFCGGRPLLIPLTGGSFNLNAQFFAELTEYLRLNPPHLLPR